MNFLKASTLVFVFLAGLVSCDLNEDEIIKETVTKTTEEEDHPTKEDGTSIMDSKEEEDFETKGDGTSTTNSTEEEDHPSKEG